MTQLGFYPSILCGPSLFLSSEKRTGNSNLFSAFYIFVLCPASMVVNIKHLLNDVAIELAVGRSVGKKIRKGSHG